MPSLEPQRRLDSWKEIADYLGKDVRTVIRWEKDRGLPVRRLPGGKRQPVFAYVAEIEAWVAQQRGPIENGAPSALPAAARSQHISPPGVPGTRNSRLPFWGSVALGVLALVFSLAGFLSMRAREARSSRHVVPPPHELQLNAGTAQFKYLQTELETGVLPYSFTAADLNGDGNMDLVFSSAPAGVIGVLLGKGDGSFHPVRLIEGCPQSHAPVVADFNGDGYPDIAVACFAGNFVLVLWGRGDGTFPQRTEIPVGGGPRYLQVGDLNGDGWPDLAVGSYGEAGVYALINHAGRFTPTLLSRFEATSQVCLADLDEDGRAEVLASVREHGTYGVAVIRLYRDSHVESVRFLKGNDALPGLAVSLHAADLDGDGILDLVASFENGGMWIRRGIGHGEFSEPRILVKEGSAAAGREFTLADLNLDGRLDLLVSDIPNKSLLYFAGASGGEFALPGATLLGSRPSPAVVADFNNDHLPDIVVNDRLAGPVLLTAAWKK